jgi:uncharacterized protein
MPQIIYTLTSNSSVQIGRAIQMLKGSVAATGFVHEACQRNNSAIFAKAWFAWANTLVGELIGQTAQCHPDLLRLSL